MNGAGPSNRPAKRQKTGDDYINRLVGRVNKEEGMDVEWGKSRYHVPHQWVYNFKHTKDPKGGSRRQAKMWPHDTPEGEDYRKLVPITTPDKLRDYMSLARRNKRPEADSYDAYLARIAGASRSAKPVQNKGNRAQSAPRFSNPVQNRDCEKEGSNAGIPPRSVNNSQSNASWIDPDEGEFNKRKLVSEVNQALMNENKTGLPHDFQAVQDGLRKERQAEIDQLRNEFRSTPNVKKKRTILARLRPLGDNIENLLRDPSLTNNNRAMFTPNKGLIVQRGRDRVLSWLDAPANSRPMQSQRRITPTPIPRPNQANNQTNRKGKRRINNI
ncbi:hypothetical protein KFL_007080010 [Klebsormidium nitens]|uniref:Uncharacterized protein n=1 Tax=Klebsormidium nitens TaxID=105231 RepID=A0A1Y1ILF1_KLENI|nr:hypothetical protein KFL_007080010 [Klebsormidium nitens]|eukprot:GAQ90962.1 hypothetical protein KFL_007080010 [Klebsormidium nitens]